MDFTPVMARLQAHAERAYPLECVGAVVRSPAGELEVMELENVATDAHRRFELSARDTLRLAREDLVAVYHSHPDGDATPSREDLEHAWEGTWLLIIPVRDGVAGAPSVTQVSRSSPRRFDISSSS